MSTSTVPDPYVTSNPGDLITAKLFNGLQVMIKQDIADQIQKAVAAIKNVEKSGDAAKLEGKTAKELEDETIERALAKIPGRTGYKMIFKRLTKEDEKVIKHELKACPLVDVYQLDYFQVVCSEDEQKSAMWVNLYLYHTSEKRLRLTGAPASIEIEATTAHPFKISFSDILDRYQVKYTENSSLGDVETEFWKVFFASPNDEFDDDQYCHSPWFDRCCGEKRTVEELKKRGDWDDIWFQMRPRKIVHFPKTPKDDFPAELAELPTAQADVQVVHFDFDTMGVQLLRDPIYPITLAGEEPKVNQKELKVMLLLKV